MICHLHGVANVKSPTACTPRAGSAGQQRDGRSPACAACARVRGDHAERAGRQHALTPCPRDDALLADALTGPYCKCASVVLSRDSSVMLRQLSLHIMVSLYNHILKSLDLNKGKGGGG